MNHSSSSSSSASAPRQHHRTLLPHLSMDVGGTSFGSSFHDGDDEHTEESHPITGGISSTPAMDGWFDMIREPLVCLGFFLLGWYGPKTLLPSEANLQKRSFPFQTTAAGDVILDFDLNHPYMEPPTVPSTMLVFTCVWVPALVVWVFGFVSNHHKAQIRASLCCFLTAVGCSEGCTQLLKVFVSRKRPNFYHLCDFVVETKRCQAPLSRLREAHLSFPSGHSSLSFCAMTFLVWFFLGKVGLARPTKIEGKRRLVALVSCLLPWAFSAFVSATRLADHWHHPADVLAGCLLGSTCTTIVYHLWYPHILSFYAGIPYSILNHANNNNHDNHHSMPKVSSFTA